MISRGLAPQPGGRVLLRVDEGVGLLQSLLKPDVMLGAGQLAQFYDTLQVCEPERHCQLSCVS